MKATPIPMPMPMPSPSEELLLGGDVVALAIEGELVVAATVGVDIDVKLAELGLAVALNWPRVACNVKRSLLAQQASLVVGPQHQVPSMPHRTMTALVFDEFPVCRALAKAFLITKVPGLTVHTDFKQNGLCQV